MAVVPVIFSGVFYPKNKKDPPLVGTFVGNAALAGLAPTHPIVLPPDVPEQPPTDPPLVIWGPGDPRPGYWVPGAPGDPDYKPPVEPPPEFPEKGPVKPFPPDGGWGYSDRTGWVFKPPPSGATPKRK